ncbi:hypothetical protein WFJ45_24020, partial [Salmonella enterica subsp. enterica serovar Minnesota]|uniref:hypothetical protein n=1 Tax=Salmonella enterica TaxID=28901 RepID=UPI003D26DBEC
TAGFEVQSSVEYEWFNFRETSQSLADKAHANPQPLSPGMQCLDFSLCTAQKATLCNAIFYIRRLPYAQHRTLLIRVETVV